MAKDLDSSSDDDLDEDNFDGDEESSFPDRAITGGSDLSIRRKIEERLERKRLMEEFDLLDDFDI
ncbi:hypothetical protein IB286_05045 [Spongiibacter sp. KMU-158]|uniref:Uncharacterized protein n=1 Tax=Spongiibacter pelagi TaxID=2760804 RepID=A0A927C0B5_9GAMM|nr:hypothetical protein [Spongiibacter pelagi]MBD2858369.1 hypothetical protein [Spongiibacter pelagi]